MSFSRRNGFMQRPLAYRYHGMTFIRVLQVHQCREICAGKFIFPHKDWAGISEGVKDLIRKMLVRHFFTCGYLKQR